MGSFRTALALGCAGAFAATVGVSGVAVADDVVATDTDFITSGPVKTLEVVAGTTVSVSMDYQNTNDDAGQTGDNGCNLSGTDSELRLAVTTTQGAGGPVDLAPAPTAFTFPTCGDRSFVVTPLSAGEVTFSFSVAGFETNSLQVEADDFDVTGMTFKLVVSPSEPEVVDGDGDGVADEDDNCPGVSNSDQADADGDGAGNVCDSNSYAPQAETQASDATGAEGDTLTTDGAFSDADGNDSLALAVPAGTPGTFTDNGDGTFGWSLGTDDDVAGSVTVTADDGEHATASMSFSYSASNVAPTVDASAVATAACTVQLGASFSDPGTADTHSATIAWGDGSADTSVAPATSPIGQAHTYAANGTFTALVTVTDDDGGSGADSAGFATKVTPSQILQPINASGAQSTFKIGSTIPVKIRVTGCDGAPVPNLTPVVSLARISADTSGGVVEEAVTAPATNGLAMRWSATDLQYIYNLSTKAAQTNGGAPLGAGEYRVRVSDPSFFTTPTADFILKK